MFENLDSIPWREVRHAYGRATDAPKWLRALDSDDENLRGEAILYFLFCCATHQGTLYPATPFVILFVIEALGSHSLAHRDDGLGRPMAASLFDFLRLCGPGQRGIFDKPHPKAPTIEQALTSGRSVYEAYLHHPEPSIRADAAWLLRYARTNA